MSKIPKNLRSYLIPKLRRIWLAWPGRSAVVNRCRVEIQEGHYKNGNPRFKVYKKCESCGKLCSDGEYQVNHKNTVVEPEVGFVDWNTYIERLLCAPEDLELLCTACNDKVTKEEDSRRKK